MSLRIYHQWGKEEQTVTDVGLPHSSSRLLHATFPEFEEWGQGTVWPDSGQIFPISSEMRYATQDGVSG